MITLRQWPVQARESLEALYRNVDQTHCLVYVDLRSDLQTENYIRIIQSEDNDGKPFLCRGIYLEDTLIGKAELTKYEDGSAELDIVIHKDHAGRGYGTQAVIELVYLVIQKNWCSLIRAYAAKDNLPAGRMLMKVGFRPVRKFKADVMTNRQGEYRLEEKEGYEMILPVPEIMVN